MNPDDGRGENQCIARGLVDWGASHPMEGNKGAHAFAAPYDTRFRMLPADQLGKGAKVIEPLLRVLDVSSAGKDTVIALAAQVRCVDCRSRLVVLQVPAEAGPVAGSSRDSMKSHDHRRGWSPIEGEPLSVGKLGSVKRDIGRLIKPGGRNRGGSRSDESAVCYPQDAQNQQAKGKDASDIREAGTGCACLCWPAAKQAL